jgi:hypothetical protein
VILFGIAIFDMPYWYYQLVRIFGTLGLAYLAWKFYQEKIKYLPIVFGVGAIFFNPIIKIDFGRDMWQIIDFVFALIVLGTIVFDNYIVSNWKE